MSDPVKLGPIVPRPGVAGGVVLAPRIRRLIAGAVGLVGVGGLGAGRRADAEHRDRDDYSDLVSH